MRNPLLKISTATLLALSSLPAAAQTRPDWPGHMYYDGGWGWNHMIFGSLMMILFWGGIILAIILAVRWAGGTSHHGPMTPPPGHRALEILKERFARGEVDKEEFEERKRLLGD